MGIDLGRGKKYESADLEKFSDGGCSLQPHIHCRLWDTRDLSEQGGNNDFLGRFYWWK